jgi:hypothetical protein
LSKPDLLKSVLEENQKAKFQVYRQPEYGENKSGIYNTSRALQRMFPDFSYDDLLCHNKNSLLKKFDND